MQALRGRFGMQISDSVGLPAGEQVGEENDQQGLLCLEITENDGGRKREGREGRKKKEREGRVKIHRKNHSTFRKKGLWRASPAAEVWLWRDQRSPAQVPHACQGERGVLACLGSLSLFSWI